MHHEIDYEAWSDAAAACLESYRHCKSTGQHCIEEPLDDGRSASIRALDDCADAALLLANLLMRKSPHALHGAAFCAEVARRTAESFAHTEHPDPRLRVAYATCQRLILVCNDLLAEIPVAVSDAQDDAVEETFPASDPTQSTSRL